MPGPELAAARSSLDKAVQEATPLPADQVAARVSQPDDPLWEALERAEETLPSGTYIYRGTPFAVPNERHEVGGRLVVEQLRDASEPHPGHDRADDRGLSKGPELTGLQIRWTREPAA